MVSEPQENTRAEGYRGLEAVVRLKAESFSVFKPEANNVHCRNILRPGRRASVAGSHIAGMYFAPK